MASVVNHKISNMCVSGPLNLSSGVEGWKLKNSRHTKKALKIQVSTRNSSDIFPRERNPGNISKYVLMPAE